MAEVDASIFAVAVIFHDPAAIAERNVGGTGQIIASIVSWAVNAHGLGPIGRFADPGAIGGEAIGPAEIVVMAQ